MSDLLIATSNAGKVREFADLFGSRFTCRSLAEYPGVAPVEETGHTFRANAVLKASGYATATRCWALADDSGLEVEALQGKPGVYSARWAAMHGAGSGDTANNALLLRQMQDVPDDRRQARFVCVLALADPQGRVVLTTEGHVDGRLLWQGVGDGGFGYDPLFFIPALGRTTAQLSAEEKHAVSHRGQAARRLLALLERVSLKP